MNTTLLIVLLSFVTATANRAQSPPTLEGTIKVMPAPTPTTPATPAGQPTAKKTTLVGELEKGRIAIGGETTGWTLNYRAEAKPRTIEVDFGKAFSATPRHGATVRLTGTVVGRNYVERGTVSTLVVSDLEELAAPK